MESRLEPCDLCLGSDYEPYLDVSPCGRELVRCRACGLVSARPTGKRFPAAGPPTRDPRTDARRAAAVMRILEAGRVLEIDCREGYFLESLDPRRYEVVGLETDQVSATRASARLGRSGVRGAVLDCALAEAHLPAESFDLVALFGSLGRSSSPRATLMEASRRLKSGGYAVIETPRLSSITAWVMGARWQPLRDPGAEFFFTPASLERLAVVCGFTPGVSRLPVPAGWPSPGTLVYVTRKSASSVKLHGLADLADTVGRVGKVSPLGATQ